MLTWTRELDGEHNGRPMYQYRARVGAVRFSIVKSTDSGFGLSVFNETTREYLTPRHGISWLFTLKRCKAEADKIGATLRATK